MTCCVGIEHEGRVWLGWDSASTDDNFVQSIVAEPKAWRTRNGWGFGFAGSWRVGQLLRHALEPPRIPVSRAERYVQRDLVAELRAVLRDELDSEVAATELLVAYRGRVWTVLGVSGWQATRDVRGYAAIGSHEAMACLHLTRRWRDPTKRITATLEAVAAHAANVRPPFDWVRV